jgi:hypothetical protein
MALDQTTNADKLVIAGQFVLAGALLWLNWSYLQAPIDTSPVLPGSEPAMAPLARPRDGDAPRLRTPAEGFTEMVSRPLFNRDRRPVVRRAPAPEAPQASADMRLVGIVRQAGEPSRALIRFANEPAGKWIAEGEEINGWVLHTVHERAVVMESGGRLLELQLSFPQRRPADEPAPDQFEAKPQR